MPGIVREVRATPVHGLAGVRALRRRASPVPPSVLTRVGALPRARSFHLLLDEKGPQGIAELCKRLALFDDRNVLAVAPEPRNAGPALRELLTRWLP